MARCVKGFRLLVGLGSGLRRGPAFGPCAHGFQLIEELQAFAAAMRIEGDDLGEMDRGIEFPLSGERESVADPRLAVFGCQRERPGQPVNAMDGGAMP